jgi:glycosyltransferase involved in cell wall biosynthesis
LSAAAPPRVSVVIPTWNRARLLCEAVDSALAQSFIDSEIVIVDDGSTDETAAVVAARYGALSRVRYVRQPNSGPATARNRGIRESRGSLIAFLDSDDLWERSKLGIQVEQLDRNADAALSFCDALVRGGRRDRGTRFESKHFRGDTSVRGIVEWNFPMCTPAVVVRRSALEEVGLFDESLPCQEDWDLWIRLVTRFPVVYVDRPLIVIRRGEDTLSRTRLVEKWRAALRLWTSHADRLERAGCPASLIRRKIAHAHKKVAQTCRSLGMYREARLHYLAWWRLQPWHLRALAWGIILGRARRDVAVDPPLQDADKAHPISR